MNQNRRDREPFFFPRWANSIRPHLTAAAVLAPVYLGALLYLAFAPGTSAVGYGPAQPVPYSHALHAGELGLDCRYCHNGVESGAAATLPATSICMNCHSSIRTGSGLLKPVRDGFESGLPLAWMRVHDLPDYAYFHHAAHVVRGVGCESCHGRIDRMEVVSQTEGLHMAWCLECHRDPDPRLRPRGSATFMGYVPAQDQAVLGPRLRAAGDIEPSTDCSTCHR